MDIWDKLKIIFLRKKKEKPKKEDKLFYDGTEPLCWACSDPIHTTHRKRKLQNRLLHKTCFKQLRNIALNGKSLDEFRGIN